MVNTSARRFALAFLCAVALFVGIWALLFPHGFYENFPGFGLVWVSPDGPYNEHLVRDVGALNLANAMLAGLALVRSASISSFTVGLVTLAYNLPHFIYHLTKLTLLGRFDQAAEMFGLGAALLASLVLIAPPARTTGRTKAS